MSKLAVVGTGRWGLNHVRTLVRMPEAELVALCDSSPDALNRAVQMAPTAQPVPSYDALLQDPSIEAVVLATPAASHAAMALAALDAGKHVLVEKPLALTLSDAFAVTEAAERRGLVLMVGHLMLYHPSVRRLKELIHAGELGDIRHVYASRLNPPSAQQDDAMWSLAPHDISLALYLIGEMPVTVSARTQSTTRGGSADTATVDLQFPSVQSRMHLSRVHPRKERKTTVVGSRTTIEFDDARPTEKLRIGDTVISPPSSAEPLELEHKHFLRCIDDGVRTDSDGCSGVDVIRILEAADRSVEARGAPVSL